MSKRVTFIHASDLHLGAPFRGLRALSSKWANRLLSAIPESYDRMVDAAIARDVDFVVVSGDIFDSARPSYGDYLHFFEGLERLGEAGILCLIGGRGYYNQTWPMDECIAEGVTREAAEQALAVQHPHAAEAPFAVGLLHTGLNLDPVKAPVDPAVLMHAGMDYWALGHIHMKYAYPSFDDPRLVFSGCIQGRDIKETGERGVFCVTLREGAKNELEFIPTASVVWQRMHVDVSDCANLPDITDKIMRELFRENGKAHCEEMVVRIALEGATPMHAMLDRADVIAGLRKHVNDAYSAFFCDALTNLTVPPRDKEALRREGLFPAVFLQVADAAIAFLQDEFIKKNIQLPSAYTRNIDAFAEAAENLVLDLLAQGDEQ